MKKRSSLAAFVALAVICAGAAATVSPTNADAAQVAARLNPNTATEAQLRGVPGLAALAPAILAARPFASQSAFDKTLGARVPAAQKPTVYAAVFVPIKLNTASREDIMLIPGMTARMAHEFEEYRPYRDLEQFNREIGKYVDRAEVDRLRSYVTLN